MKKTILLLTTILVLSAGAATFYLIKKTKVPTVSENINIPYFIDTLMINERKGLFSIASDSTSIDSRLTKLGFTAKTGNVLDTYTARAILTMQYAYDSIYPTHQFVNFRCINEIIKKYGLVFGSSTGFICDIPKYEIDSIEAFKPSYIFDRASNYPVHDLEMSMQELADIHNGYGNISGYINNTYTQIKNGAGFLGKETDLVKYAMLDMQKRPLKSTVLFLLAPSTCFTGEVNSSGNYGKIKDPIVLAPVEGGYIIVSAW